MLFTIGNVEVKQEIGIPIDKDPAPYWANFSLHFFEYKYIHQLISKGSPPANNFHGTSRFMVDLCITNDDGALSSSYKYIYPNN